MADVIMPQMGESIFEGTITKWLKKPGDKIERDEPLFEISTDKVDAEIPSPSAGVLKEIKVNEGQTVPIQTVVAVIDADGAASSAGSSAATSAPAPAPAKTEAPAQASAPPKIEAPAKPAPSPAPSAPRAAAPSAAAAPPQRPNGQKIRSSPLVRRIARENNVDLSQIPGTGAGGRISKHDIRAAIEGGAVSAAIETFIWRFSNRCRAGARSLCSATCCGRRRCIRRSRDGRPARENVLRPLRSPAYVGDAAAHRRAHGTFEARLPACVLGGRSQRLRHRRAPHKNERQIRAVERHEAHLHALLRARCGRRPARVSHGEFLRRTARTSSCTRNATSASPSRSIGA